jgi:hypothetical protein
MTCVSNFFVLGANMLLKYEIPNFENENTEYV